MEVTKTTCFCLDGQDKPGAFSELLTKLKENNVDLAGLWGFGKGDGSAQFWMVPKDPEQMRQAALTAGMTLEECTCFCICTDDKMGALEEVFKKVADSGVSLQAVDGIGIGGTVCCYVWCNKDDVETVAGCLNAS